MNKQNAILTLFIIALTGLFSTVASAAAPDNDHWQNATVIGGTSGTKVGTNAEATAQFCEPFNYFNTSTPRPSVMSVWYAWTPTESASYTFKVNSTSAPVTIAAYRLTFQLCENQPGLYPSVVAENWSYNYDTSRSQITFAATAGQTYYLKLSAMPSDPQSAVFTFGWQKNKLAYFARLTNVESSGDLLVVRDESNLKWYGAVDFIPLFGAEASYTTFGYTTDKNLAGDYDGDGVTDMVAIRQEFGHYVWYIGRKNNTLIKTATFGLTNDKPIVGDFDGDGIADVAVTRNETDGRKTWHYLRSSDGQYQSFEHGTIFDISWVGDYNGDGKSDAVAISLDQATRKYTWHILLSTSGSIINKQYGQEGDVPQSADFDGDGKTDICVFRQTDVFNNGQAGNWYFVRSSLGVNSQINIVKWGQAGDIPQAMDFLNSGKSSFAVYRNGTWWIMNSETGVYYTFNWGLPTDTPMSGLGATNYLYF